MGYFFGRNKGDQSYAKVGTFAEDTVPDRATERQKHEDQALKWKDPLQWGVYLVGVVLVLNVALLIWSFATHIPGAAVSQDFVPIFRGSCKQTGVARTLIDLAINAFSTGLLGVSTATMQALSAPTREDLDHAHQKGKWLDIGVLSARNLLTINRLRTVLCIVLGLSSIPLHLLYNSVVFESIGANDVLALWVASDVVTNSDWTDPYKQWVAQEVISDPYFSSRLYDLGNTTCQESHTCNLDGGEPATQADISAALTSIQDGLRSGSLQNVTAEECGQQFDTELNQNSNAVLLVTNVTSYNNSAILGYQWSSAGAGAPWARYFKQNGELFGLAPNLLVGIHHDSDGRGYSGDLVETAASIEYCLIQAVPGFCSIQVARPLLGVVVAMNLVKLLVIFYVVRFTFFRPLLTTGDAVVEYMENPDRATRDMGPMTFGEACHRLSPQDSGRCGDKPWTSRKLRWFTAASKTRWVVLFGLCAAALAAGPSIAFTQTANNDGGFDYLAWQSGFGETSIDNTISMSSGAAAAVLVANAPQIIISYIYVTYDGIITSMLLTKEFADYACERKGMRVSSESRGDQRSEYRMQVPIRYSLAIKVLMAVLHWLVSESLFLIDVDTYTVAQKLQQAGVIATVGYSLKAVVASLALGLAITLIPFALALRKLPAGIPLVRSCSLAISAACHPAKYEPVDAATRPLMYGVLSEEGPSGRRRVGFSSHHVDPLVDGVVYEQSGRARPLSPSFRGQVEDKMRTEDGGSLASEDEKEGTNERLIRAL